VALCNRPLLDIVLSEPVCNDEADGKVIPPQDRDERLMVLVVDVSGSMGVTVTVPALQG